MNQEQTNITTGKQIRHLRTQLGMTQEELAGELNVTRQGNRKSRFIIIVPYKIFLTFVLELDLSLMDFMKNVSKPTKKFLW